MILLSFEIKYIALGVLLDFRKTEPRHMARGGTEVCGDERALLSSADLLTFMTQF